ncbi:MAG: cation:proton antiporter, partial [Pseudomonadota bacterium]
HQGSLLLDVAELDDLSTIILMALLVALAPMIIAGDSLMQASVSMILLQIFLTLLAFLVLAAIFSRWLEPRLTAFFERREIDHEPVILVIACGFVIAALAEAAGLSLAIGAFLAGLAFSRDNLISRERPIIQGMYDFFTPFFFVGLGLMVSPGAFAYALVPGLLLLIAAVAGKLLGAGLPAVLKLGTGGGLLMAVSMVPRSEIAMVVMQHGVSVGVSEQAFAAMLIAATGTVLLTSIVLPWLLQKLSRE